MGKVFAIGRIEVVGSIAGLVGPAIQNRANDVFTIKAAVNEVFSQRGKQSGVGRRIRLAKIIRWLDDSVANLAWTNSLRC